MWNGAVRALPLKKRLRAAAIADCQALSVTPAARCASGPSARRCSNGGLKPRADVIALLSPPQRGIRLEFLLIGVS
jgi:hypothetical protein